MMTGMHPRAGHWVSESSFPSGDTGQVFFQEVLAGAILGGSDRGLPGMLVGDMCVLSTGAGNPTVHNQAVCCDVFETLSPYTQDKDQ